MARVIISSGHTASNPGIIANGLNEYELARKIAKYALKYIRLNGIISLSTPPNLDLAQRIEWINKTGYTKATNDLAIEIHINDGNKRGVEGWYEGNGNSPSLELTSYLVEAVCQETSLPSQGVKSEFEHELGSISFVHEAAAHASVLECGYIDNAEDAAFLKIEANLDAIGKGIAKGILKFYNLDYREFPVPQAPQVPMVNQFQPQPPMTQGVMAGVPVQSVQQYPTGGQPMYQQFPQQGTPQYPMPQNYGYNQGYQNYPGYPGTAYQQYNQYPQYPQVNQMQAQPQAQQTQVQTQVQPQAPTQVAPQVQAQSDLQPKPEVQAQTKVDEVKPEDQPNEKKAETTDEVFFKDDKLETQTDEFESDDFDPDLDADDDEDEDDQIIEEDLDDLEEPKDENSIDADEEKDDEVDEVDEDEDDDGDLDLDDPIQIQNPVPTSSFKPVQAQSMTSIPQSNIGAPSYGSNQVSSSGYAPLPSREERRKMVMATYNKILGREPNESDLNYFLNIGIREDDLIKKMMDSQEHLDLVNAQKEFKDLKETHEKTQKDLEELKYEHEEQQKIIENMHESIEQKNIALSKMQIDIKELQRKLDIKPLIKEKGPAKKYKGTFTDKLFRAVSDVLE